MAVDLNALTPPTQVDVAGSLAKGAKASQVMLENDQAHRADAETQQDDAVLKDYSTAPDADLFTYDGLTKAQKHLAGRVSSKVMMNLADRAGKARTSEVAYKSSLSKLNKDQLAAEKDDNEFILQNISDEMLNEADPIKRQAAVEKALADVSKLTRADGTPRVTAAEIENIRKAPVSVLKALRDSSDSKLQAATTALKEAQATESESRSEALKGGGPTEQWVGPDNKTTFIKHTKSGKLEQLGDNGEYIAVQSMPPGSQRLGARPDASAARVAASKELLDFEKNPPSPAEEQMARTYMVSRKMESLGQNSPLRPRIAMLAAKLAVEEGRSVLADNTTYKAEQGNIANLTKQYGVIKAGEQTVLGNMELMKGLIGKVDETGVPALERWIRGGKRAIEGDKDVAQLDALIQSTQTDIGKVLSASTGAAGVPVEALKKAQKYMGENLTKDQFDALYEIVPKEMAVRTDKMEAQIAGSINKISRLTARPDKQQATGPSDSPVYNVDEARQELRQAREKARSGDPLAAKVVKTLESQINTAVGGGAVEPSATDRPAPTAKDLAYLAAHPEMRAKFEARFGKQP